MNYNYWIFLSLPEQYYNGLEKGGNVVFPFFKYELFTEKAGNIPHYVSLPEVIRNRDHKSVSDFISSLCNNDNVLGIFVHNLEGMGLVKKSGFSKKVIAGPGVYAWNTLSANLLSEYADYFVYPYELTRHELKEIESDRGILTVYGRTPLMVTANCIRNTKGRCKRGRGEDFEYIEDRKNSRLPVMFQCRNCYNIIYNPVVTSLHEFAGRDIDFTDNLLLKFTDETQDLVIDILNFYYGRTKSFPVENYTKAYFVHGVE